jgi:TATA-box binding protein (TBP) (component of TFIID and TFIIIB)
MLLVEGIVKGEGVKTEVSELILTQFYSLFKTGKIVIVGAKTNEEIEKTINGFEYLRDECYHQFTMKDM